LVLQPSVAMTEILKRGAEKKTRPGSGDERGKNTMVRSLPPPMTRRFIFKRGREKCSEDLGSKDSLLGKSSGVSTGKYI